MAGYTSRIRVEGETGYATPTRNVTVPLWCGCVFVKCVGTCVFWLITRISRVYCSTDPLSSALKTTSPFIFFPPFLGAFVRLFTHLSLSSPSLLLIFYVAGVCASSLPSPSLWNLCIYSPLRDFPCWFSWVASRMCARECKCVCLRLSTGAIRERYRMYPVTVLNILMHMMANLQILSI